MPEALHDTVSIDHLALHCEQGQKSIVLAALDNAGWPSIDPDRIVVLRHLEVEGEAWAIGREAALQVRQLIQAASSPWQSSANEANAVVFSDTADMVTVLCSEVLKRNPGKPWYLQHLPISRQVQDRPPSDALLSLLSDDILQMPAIAKKLHDKHLLKPVLQELGDQRIGELISRLVYVCGFALEQNPRTLAKAIDDAEQRQSSFIAPGSTTRFSNELTAWTDIIKALPNAQGSMARVLAAILLLWKWQPHRLQTRTEAEAAFRGIAVQLSARLQPPARSPAGQGGFAIPADGKRTTEWPEREPLSISFDNTQDQAAYPPGEQTTAPAESPAKESPGITPPEQPVADFSRNEPAFFLTRCGGFFYLLNLLRQAANSRLLEGSDRSPWLHLWHLGQNLSRHMGTELDLPLQQFLARQLDLEDVQALQRFQPEPLDKKLFEFSEQRLSHQPFWPDGLIKRLARVRHEPGLLDVDFHHQNVDLDIRLAGLDINPGWLPWLGRIVTFHYLEDTELRDTTS